MISAMTSRIPHIKLARVADGYCKRDHGVAAFVDFAACCVIYSAPGMAIMLNHIASPGRREFLRMMGLGAAALTLSNTAFGAGTGGKALRGLFPIGFSPFTEDNKLDLDGLAAEVKFCNRGGVHGFVWPQIASGWTTLSEKERFDGAEAILAAGKGGKTALV